jgi:peptidoglycan/xylan/chitin deacetylase (PgdA/CDA1 family)
MKRLFFSLCYILGLPALFRLLHKNALTIVLYHGVAPHLDQGIYNYRGKFLRPDIFEAQLKYLKKHYTVLSLDRALTLLQDGTLPSNSLVVTFDDGYRNFYDYAYPLLGKYGVPATVFLATDFVFKNEPLWVDRLEYAIGRGDGSRAEKIAHDEKTRARLKTLSPAIREHDLRNEEQISWTQFQDFTGDREVYAPLTKSQMSEMQLDHVSFGAHTRSHPILSTLTRAEQDDEIEGSRIDIAGAGLRASPAFAYPNGQRGDWNEDTETVLAAHGFTYALTTLEGVNTKKTRPLQLHRIVLDGTERMSVFANVVTGVRVFFKSLV